MFGYVRPLFRELKVKEYHRFGACYCGLCHALRRRYGVAARFILNYDFVFLAMLLWDAEVDVAYDFKRCAASPCLKKCVCRGSDALDRAAGESVILAWHKLEDDVRDEPFFRALKARLARLFLAGAYRKAKNDLPVFDGDVKAALAALAAVEREGTASLDEAADKFATLLAGSADGVQDGAKRRILDQLLYHVGRTIYIIDAADDLKSDLKAGRYNAVASRYGLTDPVLDAETKAAVKQTIGDSIALISADIELLQETKWSEILRNTVNYGMPEVAEQVLSGTFRHTNERFYRRNLNTIQE